jgi:hypothetical protein
VFSRDFTAKLCCFGYSRQVGSDQINANWKDSALYPPFAYCAPELILNQSTPTPAADVFSYGALVSSMFLKNPIFSHKSPSHLISSLSKGNIVIQNVPDEIQPLLQCCIDMDPIRRLRFEEIRSFPCFSSYPLRQLRYADEFLLKTENERFEWYRGFRPNIFSGRLLKVKFLPLLISEVQRDYRFGSVILPIIFRIVSVLCRSDVYDLVIMPLGALLQKMDPQAFGISVLDGLPILIEKVEIDQQYNVVYPVIAAALDSQNKEIKIHALKRLPVLLGIVKSLLIDKIFAKINEIIVKCEDVEIINECIGCYCGVVSRVEHDDAVETIFPCLQKVWRRMCDPEIADRILEFVKLIQVSLFCFLRFIVPCICEILANSKISVESQTSFFAILKEISVRIRGERRSYSPSIGDINNTSQNGSFFDPSHKQEDLIDLFSFDSPKAVQYQSNGRIDFSGLSETGMKSEVSSDSDVKRHTEIDLSFLFQKPIERSPDLRKSEVKVTGKSKSSEFVDDFWSTEVNENGDDLGNDELDSDLFSGLNAKKHGGNQQRRIELQRRRPQGPPNISYT